MQENQQHYRYRLYMGLYATVTPGISLKEPGEGRGTIADPVPRMLFR